jgi:hypothetical protein
MLVNKSKAHKTENLRAGVHGLFIELGVAA